MLTMPDVVIIVTLNFQICHKIRGNYTNFQTQNKYVYEKCAPTDRTN